MSNITAGQKVYFEGHKTGTVLQVKTGVIGFDVAVQVESDNYHNKMWFEAVLLKPVN